MYINKKLLNVIYTIFFIRSFWEFIFGAPRWQKLRITAVLNMERRDLRTLWNVHIVENSIN